MEQTDPISTSTEPEVSLNQDSGTRGGSKVVKIALFGFLGALSAVGIFFVGLKYGNAILARFSKTGKEVPPIAVTQEATPSSHKEVAKPGAEPAPSKEGISQLKLVSDPAYGKVFYTDYWGKIFYYDTRTGQTELLADYSTPDNSVSTKTISVLTSGKIGFGMCDTVSGDFGCGLYLLDITTKSLKELKKFGSKDFLLSCNFASPDVFSYLLENDTQRVFYLSQQGEETALDSLDVTPYSRGGFIEDSDRIRFSPDKKHLFQIDTASPRGGMDFNVYVYDLTDLSNKRIIENATHPEWLSNTKIVFRKYSTAQGDSTGFYVYDVTSGLQARFVDTGSASYYPEIMPGTSSFLYTNYPEREVWLYDSHAQGSKLVAADAMYGVWVTPELVIYSKIEGCEGDCGPASYYETGVILYDAKTGDEVGSLSPLERIYTTATLYSN